MKTEIRAVELVRSIRDRQAENAGKKTTAEIIEFFRRSGTAALEDARRRTAPPVKEKR
jgi:hypothetical protein